MGCQELGSDTVEVFKGESKTLRLTVLDENRDPQDLAGTTITMTVRKKLGGSATIFQKTSAIPTEINILTPTTDGQADIFITPSDTSGLTAEDYVYDIWIILISGKKVPVIKPSLFKIKLAVTILP